MNQCLFCSQNIEYIDYKNPELLRRFTSSQAKIVDPRFTGSCASHQRHLAQAIKRARYMGLLPFVRR
ncbi:MAG: 30S ribosomal protein S18 [Patescibacteria group bacterium]